MRALILDYEGKTIRETEQREPVLSRPDEVLFRVIETGVCGTDRELAAFHFGYGPPGDGFLIPGHEALGQVIKAGPEAPFAEGDIVAPLIRRACNPPCASCRAGRRDLCRTGKYTERGIFGEHGYFTELAVDRAEDLVAVPADAVEYGVLIEPLSVVEKAVELAMRLHQGEPRTAIVIGAGTIGLLAAAVLRLRGIETDLLSVEPPDSPRAQLAGPGYTTELRRKYDVAIEAAGVPAAASAGLNALAPLGVMIVLGAPRWGEGNSLWDFIGGNQIVAGSVNASPEAFRRAAADLPLLPRELLDGMIDRRSFGEWRTSLLEEASGRPKIVHRIG